MPSFLDISKYALSGYDLFVLVFYFCFLASIGWITRKFVANTSDYFRGGGKMLWWMAGASAFMTQFSAWSFTGAASEAYLNGPIVLSIFFANALGFLGNYLYFAPKFRQMRVITPIQAVRQRYGVSGEQLFTWLQIPVGTLNAGIWLMGLSIFISSIFGFNLEATIMVTGLIVLFNSTMGGSWAVVSSDFMQVIILMMIAMATAAFALIDIGGPVELIQRFPAEHIILGNDFNYPALIIAWIALMQVNQFYKCNHMIDASRYLSAKDSHNAKRAALLSTVLFVVGPILWFIPPMAAAIKFPDIGSIYPQLGNPSEAAYVAMATSVLPKGMIGLLLAGMFAATISSMDSGLNRNAGLFTKNFYLSVLRKNAGEREQMIVAKTSTLFLGCIIIFTALFYSRLQGIGLFDLMIQIGALLSLPAAVPLLWGMVVKKTPDWSGWSTAIFGLGCSFLVWKFFNAEWANQMWDLNLTSRELRYLNQAIAVAVNTTLPTIWFFGTMFFYQAPVGVRKEESETYWKNLNTPVLEGDEGCNIASDGRQGKVLGGLAGAYGLFVFLLVLVPNGLGGHLAFILCGSALMGLAYALYKSTRPKQTT